MNDNLLFQVVDKNKSYAILHHVYDIYSRKMNVWRKIFTDVFTERKIGKQKAR